MASALRVSPNRRIAKQLGPGATAVLEHAANCFTRILPHTQVEGWRISAGCSAAYAGWQSPNHRRINIRIGVEHGDGYTLACQVRRRKVPAGVGSIERTLSIRELRICKTIAAQVTSLFAGQGPANEQALRAVSGVFDELVVAKHLKEHHRLRLSPEDLFAALRSLSQQTYENHSLAFGCVVDGALEQEPATSVRFPADLLEAKRYRALSDAYYTAYLVSGSGAVVRFLDLKAASQNETAASRNYFPAWTRDLALYCRERRLGLALTRNGDLLVFDNGTLQFSCRFGRWQYWNHAHLADLLKNTARVQRVPRRIIPRVTGAIYRAALDVSFRRSGGLFVLLRNRQKLSELVRDADQIGSPKRSALSQAFDGSLPSHSIQDLPRTIAIELAALDGAVVLDNQGRMLAYGAVLEPRNRGRRDGAEGSRTKAAIGASNYGLSVKVSSDGDITVFVNGREFIRV